MKQALMGIIMLMMGAFIMSCSESPKSGIELTNIDKSVRPQDNFYTYVNGKWLERTQIPEDKSNFGSFTELADQNEKRIKSLIDDIIKKDHPVGSDAQKIKDLYLSFMDSNRVESLHIKPLEKEFKKILDATNKKELAKVMGYLRKVGVRIPFAPYVSIDDKNATRYITFITQSGLGLPDKSYYFQKDKKFETIRKQYVEYISKILELAGISNSEKKAEKIFKLEKDLARYQWTRVENRDVNKTYNKFSKEELVKHLSPFDVEAFLESASLTNEKEFVVRQPSYLEGFAKLWRRKNTELWKDYLVFKYIQAYSDYLASQFVNADFDFYGKVLQGIPQQKPRWKRALSFVNGSVGMLMGKLYVEKYFPPEAKTRMITLVENLRKSFEQRIEQLEWMSDETKKAAIKKLHAFNPKIGYPDKWREYEDLKVTRDDLIGNAIRVNLNNYYYNINKLGKPIDRTEWFMTPHTVNAYYNPTMNEIVFPAAILEPPFFNLQADDAVNYGAIGAVIGHEMTHGFDDQGAQYDADGNLKMWWTEKDFEEFKKRGSVLEKQYNEFSPIDTFHVNGKLTLGENIADLGGVTIAYYAYKLSLNGKEAPVIDGLTGDQRFFMGWAQVWRRKYRPEELIRRLKTDPHSPSEYRVNGVFRNMNEFYETYQVTEGDSLYLPDDERVVIW